MKTKIFLLGAASLLLASCSSELDTPLNEALGSGKTNLSINVVTENIESKGLVTDSYLASGAEIGVTVLNTSGGNYDGIAYNNIKFTSSGTSTSQTWAGASAIKLSATDGYCYAYYPYSSSVTDITSVPVASGQTDYMYAKSVTVNDKAKTAALSMKHALSAVTVTIKKGTYTGTGKVTAFTWTSPTAGTSAKMNAKTGALSSISGGGGSYNSGLSSSSTLTISTSGNSYSFVAVPTGTAGKVTFNLTIDGKTYTVQSNSLTFAAGSKYNFTVTVDAKQLSLSGVQVTAWTGVDGGSKPADRVKDTPDPAFTAGGYKITYSGTSTGMSTSYTVSENEITIVTTPTTSGKGVKIVSATNCTMYQYLESSGKRTIVLNDLTGDVDITFNGVGTLSSKQYDYYQSAGTYSFTVPSGVTNIDAFIVGGGGGCCRMIESNCGNTLIAAGGSGYTKLYRGTGYVKPESSTWDGNRDGNSIPVKPGATLSLKTGYGGGSSSSSQASRGGSSSISGTRLGSFSADGGHGGSIFCSQYNTGNGIILILSAIGGSGGSGGAASVNTTSGVGGGSNGSNGSKATGSVNVSGIYQRADVNINGGTGQGHTTNYSLSAHRTSGIAVGGNIGSEISSYGAGGGYNGSARPGMAGYIYIEYYSVGD